MPGDGNGRSGLDRDLGMPEYGGTNDVSVVGAGAGVIGVFAGFAGRDGNRQYNVGRTGGASGVAGYAAVLGIGAAGGAFDDPTASVERAAFGDGAFGGEGLKSSL